jgi:hypothetical protein
MESRQGCIVQIGARVALASTVTSKAGCSSSSALSAGMAMTVSPSQFGLKSNAASRESVLEGFPSGFS